MNFSQQHKAHAITSHHLDFLLFLIFFWSLAIAQPIMTMTGSGPTFLIAHDVKGWSLIFYAVMFSFLPPLILWVTSILIGFIVPFLKEWLARLATLALISLFILPMVNNFTNQVAFASASTISLVALIAIIKLKLTKTIANWLSPLSLLFLCYFLFFSAASQLLPKLTNQDNQQVYSAESKNPLFVIVLDEFPLPSILKDSKEINSTRFPNFAKFASESTWYPEAKAIASATELALPAILTGIDPWNTKGRIAVHDQFPHNLFTLMNASHRINASESDFRMCPAHICQSGELNSSQLLLEDTLVIYLHRILPVELRNKLPSIKDRWIGFLHEFKQTQKTNTFSKRQESFNEFVNSFEAFPENTFHFLHILVPHAPWKMLPDLKLYGFYEPEGVPGELNKSDPGASVSHQWTDDSWATRLAWRRHLLQIGAVDTLLGKALDKIKGLGLYEQSMIVVVSDHGSSFIPTYSRRFAQDKNYSGIASIPLFIKYPNQSQGQIDHRQASNLDILPTVLDVFNIGFEGHKIDGLSLIQTNFREQALDMTQEGAQLTPVPADYDAQFKEQLLKQNELFPDESWEGIYKTKALNPIYQTPVDQLNITDSHENSIKISNSNLYKSTYQNTDRYLPVYYRISRLIDHPADQVLVAVNGQIVSHCYYFVHANNQCGGLIDPRFLYHHDKQDLDLRFFALVSKNDDIITVHELTETNNSETRLIEQDGNTLIKVNNDLIMPVEQDVPIYGTATLKYKNNQSVYEVSGWAGNTISGEPAKEVMLFIDDQLYTSVNTGVEKNYLLKKFGFESLTNSGYQINVPVQQFPKLENNSLRLFASNGSGKVGELNYHSNNEYPALFKAFANIKIRQFNFNTEALVSLLIDQNEDKKPINKLNALASDTTEFMAGDWYNISDGKRWVGNQIIIVLPPKNEGFDLDLSMTAYPFLREGIVDQQSIELFINDKKVDEFHLTERKNHTFNHTLTVNNKDNEPIIIVLKMPFAVSPFAIGDGQDVRDLSVILSKFQVVLK